MREWNWELRRLREKHLSLKDNRTIIDKFEFGVNATLGYVSARDQ